jgi:hypothetical protein
MGFEHNVHLTIVVLFHSNEILKLKLKYITNVQ